MDDVAAKKFYMDDGDKIKLNWCCYEYANNFFREIQSDPKLSRYRENHSRGKIVEFCVYYAKRMRKSVFDLLTGKTKAVEFHGAYIYEFYPKNSYAQTQALLEASLRSWEEQLQMCSTCSNQCLADGFERTDMFDTLEKTGWPT